MADKHSYKDIHVLVWLAAYCATAPCKPFHGAMLKTVDTIGNCQRIAFTVDVSQHMHKTTHLWKFELNRSSKLRDNNERKNSLVTLKLCALRCLISRPHILNLRSRNQIRGKLLLSRKLHHFRVSCFYHNVLYYQPLPITRNQERFYGKKIILSKYK